jgi:hypothetical protein
LDRGFDGSVGDGAQGLGGIVLVAFEFDTAEAVGVGFNAQRADGGVGSERGAGEMLTGRAGVAENLAAAEGEEKHRTSSAEHRTSKFGFNRRERRELRFFHVVLFFELLFCMSPCIGGQNVSGSGQSVSGTENWEIGNYSGGKAQICAVLKKGLAEIVAEE